MQNGASVNGQVDANKDGFAAGPAEESRVKAAQADAPPKRTFATEAERIEEQKEKRDWNAEQKAKPFAFNRFAYHVHGDQFYYDHGGYWGPVGEQRLKDILEINHHISDSKDYPSVVTEAIVKLTEKCVVFDIAQVAGYKAGVQLDTRGRKFLVPESTNTVEPVDRPWPLIKRLLTGMFGVEQTVYFHCWMKWGLEALRDQTQAPGHYLNIMGPHKCGKTLLQEKIISPLFGCEPTDMVQYVTGVTSFNGDLLRSFHLMISDGLSLKSYPERKKYTEAIKRLLANSSQRLEAKYQNAMNVTFCCRLSCTLNESAINSLPLLEEGMTDKLLLLKAKTHRHLPSSSFPRPNYEKQLREELPGYVHFLLNDWKIPAEIKETDGERLGFKAYQNPEILDNISDASREQKLAEILRKAYPLLSEHEDSPGGLFQELTAFKSPVRDRLLVLCDNDSAFGHILMDLKRATDAGKSLLGVEVGKRKSNGSQLYRIKINPAQ
jgi:hypothetical protein